MAERRASERRRWHRARQVDYIDGLDASRLWFEVFERLIRELGIEDEIEAVLEWAAGVNIEALRALGADRIPLLPLQAVGQ